MQELYDKNHFSRMRPASTPKIPKVLHQIWLGSEFPKKYRNYLDNWRKLHPDWQYRLWTDRDVESFDFRDRELFDRAQGFGEKTDILRAEIFYRHGGMYSDCDYNWFKSFDVFHHLYDFYGTTRTSFAIYLSECRPYATPIWICNSIFGVRPEHPILAEYLRIVREKWYEDIDLYLRERYSSRRLVLGKHGLRKMLLTTTRTYLPFGEAVLKIAPTDHQNTNIILPTTFFNPIDKWAAYRFIVPRYWLSWLRYRWHRGMQKISYFQEIKPHSFTHHNSEASWLA